MVSDLLSMVDTDLRNWMPEGIYNAIFIAMYSMRLGLVATFRFMREYAFCHISCHLQRLLRHIRGN